MIREKLLVSIPCVEGKTAVF